MHRASLRARIREGALSLLALAALASILFVMDFRVREQAARAVSATSGTNVMHTGAELSATASKLVADLRNDAMEHAPIVSFVGIAGVLLLFMFKT